MIFADCIALDRGEAQPRHTAEELFSVMKRHVSLACAYKSEHRAMPELRKHLLWYLGHLSGGKPYKAKMAQVTTETEFLSLCGEMETVGLTLKR